jgi:hypothetical protein
MSAATGPDEPTRARANALLGRVGMRLMNLDGEDVVGLWSDMDGPEVRAALAVFHPDGGRFAYLDGNDIPMRFRERRVAGEPVPASVLAAMAESPEEPWVVRDQMLSEMGWSPRGSRGRRQREQGVTGKPGRITSHLAHPATGGEKKFNGYPQKTVQTWLPGPRPLPAVWSTNAAWDEMPEAGRGQCAHRATPSLPTPWVENDRAKDRSRPKASRRRAPQQASDARALH